MILEGLAVSLGTVAIKGICKILWDKIKGGDQPVVNSYGNLDMVTSQAGRTLIRKDFTVPGYQDYGVVIGGLYLPASIHQSMDGSEVPLMLVVEETTQQILLFEADLDEEYELYLPEGIYSFYVFLVDGDADELLDAEIYAIGLPCTLDLSAIQELILEDPEDISNYIDDSPLEIIGGESGRIDFLLLDRKEYPEFPSDFAELFGEEEELKGIITPYDLSGHWLLEEEYEFGRTVADVHLVQFGSDLTGLVLIHDVMDDGTELIIQEFVTGEILGTRVSLEGNQVRVLKGKSSGYELDEWLGEIENNDRISGYSEDAVGTPGKFTMERLSNS